MSRVSDLELTKSPCRKTKCEGDAIVFYKEDKLIHSNIIKKPLYVTIHVHDVELRRELVDQGSYLNIMPLSNPLKAWG